MDVLRPPESLHFTGNVSDNWRRFLQCFELYWEATSTTERSDAQKLAMLLHVAGSEAITVSNTFVFSSPLEHSYSSVVAKFDAYCAPRTNETHERYMFRSRLRQAGETIEHFVTDLKLKAKTCNFGVITDSIIRDQIVFGIGDLHLQSRLLSEDNLTLDRAIQLCLSTEIVEKQLQAWDTNMPSSRLFAADAVTSKGRQPSGMKVKVGRQDFPTCRYCGVCHVKGSCPAFGKRCLRCGKLNHFAIVCRSSSDNKRVDTVAHAAQDMNESSEVCVDVDKTQTFFVDGVASAQYARDWTIKLLVNNTEVEFKVDTGAQVDLLPLSVYKTLNSTHKLNPCSLILRSYGGTKLSVCGEFPVELRLGHTARKSRLIVVEQGTMPILGLQSCESFGLISRICEVLSPSVEVNPNKAFKTPDELKQHVKSSFPNLFRGVGCVSAPHTIRLRKDSVPVIQPPRRVPFALRERLKNELDRMENAGIISRVDEPTEWVSSLVIVEKSSGELRLCLDPKNLNSCIQREHFQIPTKDELLAEVAGAKYFSQLDANSGFYQIPLDAESAKLCTFNTPFGRYCFQRLPFGLASSPEIFHKCFSQLFEGLPGVCVYFDNILIWGSTEEEHFDRLMTVLEIAEQAHVTLNESKCDFGVQEISFLGDILSDSGIYPDPTKVEAILRMPVPETKEDVARILGLLNYLAKFLPNLSSQTTALRSLLRKDVVMQWLPEHDREWTDIQKLLTSAPVLQFYDPVRPVLLSVDASRNGLGAVLLQRFGEVWKPISYASRSLSDTEQRYAQIEEALAMVFGCERFHSLLYGRFFMLQTDHRPLVAIQKKTLSAMPPRLQRLFLRLLKYQYDLSFVPGRSLVIADTLSRASLPCEESSDDFVQLHVDLIISTLPISARIKTLLQHATVTDHELAQVVEALDGSLTMPHPYHSFLDEICLADGILLKGHRIIVPKELRPDFLQCIHEGHLGIEKCRRRAREHVYWPGMNSDIEAYVKNCQVCCKYQYSQPGEPLLMRQYEPIPWHTVGSDLFQVGHLHYLVVVDAYSNYPEVEELTDLSATAVIQAHKKIFSRHGIPVVLFSDNGPQYSAYDFQQFAVNYGFDHRTSSPHYPQSNGLAEKAVQIVKRILIKAEETKTDPEIGLLNYRSTPLDDGRSPAQLLMGRSLRTKLPQATLQEFSPVSKKCQTRHGKDLSTLRTGDSVRIHQAGKWPVKASVISQVAPRSYQVLTEHGSMLRRNRQHLQKVERQQSGLLSERPVVSETTFNGEMPGNDDPTRPQAPAAEEYHVNHDVKDTPSELRRSGRVRRPVIRLNL